MNISDQGLWRVRSEWQLRTRRMGAWGEDASDGIVNITPDSFSDGELYLHPERAIEHGLALLDEGADILDLGAESTRPGSAAGMSGKWEGNAESEAVQLSSEEEQARLLPVIAGVLQARPDAVISVDTYKAETARAAVAAGAEIVNDVSGFSWDGEMAGCCARLGCGVVLMHTRGLPSEWKTQPGLKTNEVLPWCAMGWLRALVLRSVLEFCAMPLSLMRVMDLARDLMRTTACWRGKMS